MATPILCTGRTEHIAGALTECMKPEYEVINYTTAATFADELPTLIQGKAPANPSSVGTNNFASPPQALLIGAGFEQADIDKLKALTDATPGALQIPWLWIDNSKGDAPAGKPTEEEIKAIGEKVALRMKEALNKLKEEGKLGNGNPGVTLV